MDPRLFYSGEGEYPITQLIESLDSATLFDNHLEKENITKSLKILIRDEYDTDLTSAKVDSLYKFFNKAEKRMKPKSFLAQSIRSLRGFSHSALDSTESNNARDAQMSNNIYG